MGIGAEAHSMRAFLDPYPRRRRDFETPVDGLDLELGAGKEAELVAKRLRHYQASSGIDGRPHGINVLATRPLFDGVGDAGRNPHPCSRADRLRVRAACAAGIASRASAPSTQITTVPAPSSAPSVSSA